MPFKRFLSQVKLSLAKGKTLASKQAQNHPLRTFGVLLGLLFLLIVASNFLTKPQVEEARPAPAKEVGIYSIGTAPKLTVQGQVEKLGVIPIIAQNAGIVQQIYAEDGAPVAKGATLIGLSSNYQGGNALTIQRQIAQTQYQNIKDTYQTQLDIIANQKSLATASAQNSENIAKITAESVNNTQNLVNLNSEILVALRQNLDALIANNGGGVNDALILSTKQIIAQVSAGQNQTIVGLQNAQNQTAPGNPGTLLPQVQKDLALKQLDLQEKALKTSKEISGLQVSLASIAEATMYPSAPFSGTIQKVFVKVGQNVTPGTTLAVLSSEDAKGSKVTVYVSQTLAQKVSKVEPSSLHLGKTTLKLVPTFVSTEAVSGNLYSITFVLDSENASSLTDKAYIAVDLPIGYAGSTSSDPYLPIDVIYQSPDSAYIYVVKDGKAVSQKVTLGQIFGSFVEVTSGLSLGDKVITNRTIIAGDKVHIAN